MTVYTFKSLWDRFHRWTVYGDAHHTGYTIEAKHTSDNKERNVVDEYNKEKYLRTPSELDVMGRMHTAYRESDKDQLEDLVAIAERTFDGSKQVVALYKFAATKL